MKAKLLKKLRRKGRNQIHVNSVTTSGGIVIGMSISYSDSDYSSLFWLGRTKNTVLKEAERIYIQKYLAEKRALTNER